MPRRNSWKQNTVPLTVDPEFKIESPWTFQGFFPVQQIGDWIFLPKLKPNLGIVMTIFFSMTLFYPSFCLYVLCLDLDILFYQYQISKFLSLFLFLFILSLFLQYNWSHFLSLWSTLWLVYKHNLLTLLTIFKPLKPLNLKNILKNPKSY